MPRSFAIIILSMLLISVFVLDVNAQRGMRGGRHGVPEEQPSADEIIEKMKTQVNLTKQQADALKPIIELIYEAAIGVIASDPASLCF